MAARNDPPVAIRGPHSLRVVVVLKTNQGGAWILPHLEELRARGHHPSVILPAGNGRLRRSLDDEEYHVVDSAFDFRFRPSFSTLVGLRGLRAQISELRPDIVNYHLYASALAVRLSTLRLPLIRVHMVPGPLYLDSTLIRCLERSLVRLDSALVPGSAYTLRRYVDLHTRLPRIVSIPYGVDTQTFTRITSDERTDARVRFGVSDDAFVAILVAYVYAPKHLVSHRSGIKGHDVLLDAWESFVRDHPEAKLLLVGGGFDAAGHRYRDALMARRVSGVSWIDTLEDVRVAYAAADISVSPSLSENHGAALEASALGLPSIVSDAGGLPETVTPASGWVVPAGDRVALLAALNDASKTWKSGLLESRASEARKLIVDRFDSADAARRLTGLFEDLSRARQYAPVVVVSEARLGRNSKGEWLAADGVNGDTQWGRYAARLGNVTLIARGEDEPAVAGDELRRTAVTVLPNYVGWRGLLRNFLPVVSGMMKAVSGSSLVILRVPGPLSTLAAGCAWVRRIPYAVEMVGDPQDVIDSGAIRGLGPTAAALSGNITKAIVAGAVAARYVTQTTLQDRYPAKRGVPVASIPNVRLQDCDYVLEARASWAGAPLRIIAVGSQENSYKGHDTLIAAARRIRDGGLEVVLDLVGAGRYQQTLRQLSSQLAMDECVRFLGFIVDRDELRSLFDQADILVHPSRTEGVPRVILEAMARGLPVVATSVGGIPEIVPAQQLAAKDDPALLADTILELMMGDSRYAAASAVSLETASRYHADRLDQQFDEWTATLARYGR